MSKKDFSVALKYVEARPRSQRRKGTEARVSGISVVGSGVSATDLSLLQANLISVTNNFTALKDLFDSMFEKDSDGNIHAKLSLWSSGGITAGGVGSGGSGGGGGISYNRLDSWADYSAEKAGYVLSALLGKDLDNRVSALANAGYVTQSALAPYALRSEIPSLVGYATQSWVSDNYLSKSGGTINGSTTLSIGNLVVSSGDTVVGKIYPRTDNEYTLGQDTRKWKNILCYNINGSTPVNASNLKSTLGISDWALASVKPTYTASEVGALSVYGGTVNGGTVLRHTNSLILTIKRTGSGASLIGYDGDEGLRGGIGFGTDGVARIWDNTLSGNYPILTSDNFSQYALPITGGTLSGSNRDLLRLDTSNTSGPRITLYENGNLIALIGCVPKQTTAGYGAYFVNVSSQFGVILGNDKKAYITLNTDTMSKDYQILHSGNYSDLLAGGSINGDLAVKGDIILAPTDTSDVSILFRSGTLNDSAYDYKIGKFTDANGKEAFGMAMAKPNGSWVKFLGVSTDGEYNVSKIDLLTNVEVNGTLKTTGALTAPSITTNSLTIGGVTLTYDSGNEALCINGYMYALGGITAGSAGISAYTSLEARVARLEQQLNIS